MPVSSPARLRLEKAGYYLSNYLSLLGRGTSRDLAARARDRAASAGLEARIAYCLGRPAEWDCAALADWPTLADLRGAKRNVYFFDLHRYTRDYPPDLHAHWRFGDITECQPVPTLVKSRPIGECAASVLFRLNTIRHFRFVDDPLSWEQKKDLLVWRGGAYRENRQRLLREWFDHPQCDIGHVAKERSSGGYDKPFLSIPQQLACKFVLSLEGNDVATNLKWILSSNSLCVMPPPRFETWFMEGRLQPGVHYAAIRADFSDLGAVIDHYLRHPEEARTIVRNGHAWVRQFTDPQREALLSYRVLDEYFVRTGQIAAPPA